MIAICSRSVSQSQHALNILKKNFKNIKINKSNKILANNSLVNFVKNCKIIIIGIEKIDKKFLDRCPDLKVIIKYGVGTNNIDFKYLKKKKIKIVLQHGINKRAVSEITLGFILIGLRKIYYLLNEVKKKSWPFIFGNLLTNKKVGIIGCGNIGQDLYKILKPFKCEIFLNDINKKNNFLRKKNSKSKNLKFLLKNSDIISLHIPLNEKNKLFITKREFSLMKKDVIFINTSRGGIVNENSLYLFLKKNKNSNAFFDVMLKEPISNQKLLKLKNFYLTPHLAGSTKEILNKASIDCASKAVRFKNIYK